MSAPSERLAANLSHSVGQQILEDLDAIFPEATPVPGAALRDIDVAIGKREAVRFMKSLLVTAE